jgi:hypothetical protein
LIQGHQLILVLIVRVSGHAVKVKAIGEARNAVAVEVLIVHRDVDAGMVRVVLDALGLEPPARHRIPAARGVGVVVEAVDRGVGEDGGRP